MGVLYMHGKVQNAWQGVLATQQQHGCSFSCSSGGGATCGAHLAPWSPATCQPPSGHTRVLEDLQPICPPHRAFQPYNK